MSDFWIDFVTNKVVPGGLMLVMFSMGLTLALRDFAMVLRAPKLVGAGFVTHLFVLPLLAFLVGLIFQLSPERALGLFIVSLCPAGTTSNAMTFVGRGNVALAVILTALSAIVTVFTIPIVLSWAVPWFLAGAGRSVPSPDPLGMMRQLALITLLPIVVGMVLRHFAPGAAARLARRLRPTAFVIVVVVIAISILGAWRMVLDNLLAATPATYALNLLAIGFGLLLGKALGASARDAMTLSIETSVQNVTLSIFLTLTVLGSLPLAVTQNIYGVVMILNATLLIRWWRRRIEAEAQGGPA
ncbi:MAG: bile acid:sodium symporter family protein [Sphingomonadaceae bacterium]|nr:bile acid:sodium symporter family protein [Sphingomonadaceae bacterium]